MPFDSLTITAIAAFAVALALSVFYHQRGSRIPRLISLLFGILMGAYLGYKVLYPTYRYSQKLTITISTANGPISGTAIQAVEWVEKPRILTDFPGRSVRIKGDAIFVDLKDGRYLAALLTDTETLSWSAIMTTDKQQSLQLKIPRDVDQFVNDVIPLNLPQYPKLVLFPEISNSTRVIPINPSDPSATLGEGYALESITLTITTEDPDFSVAGALLPCIENDTNCFDPVRGIRNSDIRRQ